MRVRTVALLAGLGMTLSSMTVWSLTERDERVEQRGESGGVLALESGQRSYFTTGGAVRLEGRLGHSELRVGRETETFALLRVRGAASEGRRRAAMHLVIVIDRSGSMAGKRLDNALAAARGAVTRLSDEDLVSVVEYASDARLLVAPTSLAGGERQRVIERISRISSGGETCISCALRTSLEALRSRDGLVDRVLLLSDGEPTTGALSVEGLRTVADDVRRAGASITTVGVDVDYNERIMAEIARQANGRHYFVENAEGLPAIFAEELEGLGRTVAHEATLELEPGRGVELVEVLDRSFRREGKRLVVSLGTAASDEEKTVLVKLRARATATGERDLLHARLSYREAATGDSRECSGTLAADFVERAVSDRLDPLVDERVRRSSTVGVLTEANQLFNDGNVAGARDRIEQTLTELRKSRSAAVARAPLAHRADVDRDFDRQERALGAAAGAFATPPPAGQVAAKTKAGKAAVRSNQAKASELAF